MATVTANGVSVIDGSITRPLVGVWTADLRLDQPDGTGFAPGTAVTISSDNGYSISGTIDPNRTGSFLEAVYVRVVAGKAGMANAATPRSYVQPSAFVRDVLNGLMNDSGETLSTTIDPGFLSTNLAAWSVIGGKTVTENLRALLNIVAPTFDFRFLPDGTLWIGSETWPAATGNFQSLSKNPADGSYDLGIDAPFLAPGTSLDGVGNVNLVVDTITSNRLRTQAWINLPGEGNLDFAGSIQRIVNQSIAGIDYYGLYLCSVVTQSADLTTVDISPVGARNQALLGGLQRVPVRMGSGIGIKFVQGATVLLGWDGGDPSTPYVVGGLASDSPQAINLAGSDPVITKEDLAELIKAIKNATYLLASGPGVTGTVATPLVFIPPSQYGSTKVGAGR